MPTIPRFVPLLFLLGAVVTATRAADLPVTISIDPNSGQTPISPLIYGSNQDIPGVRLVTRRLGGNRTTGYNWENNASNAGSDWFHQSDNFLTWNAGIPPAEENIPGIVITDFHDTSLADGAPYSIVTLPMAGYVARDKNGPVAESEVAPSSRWVEVRNTKPGPYSLTPDTTDAFVYNDELLNFLVDRYGPASGPTGIRAYNLDNEPDLWSHTHARLHPVQPQAAELVTRTVDLASAIKQVDPSAEVFGFVSYGFNGYYSFQDAPDWLVERAKGSYRWYLDYFLDQMRQASETAGQRLLDVVDLHNYTEHIAGGERVNVPSTWGNAACNAGRMQAPRSYWDPTFLENSWIGQWQSSFLPLLPNFKASIEQFYPGTKLAITEYNFGGESHISGGIAQADTLGIFGREGVYAAAWWQLHDNPTYIAAAFNLYLDYDGAGAVYGDTAVAATASDRTNCSVHAAIDSENPDRLHVIVLNKSSTQAVAGTFTIAGNRTYTSGRVWAFDQASPAITERSAVGAITNNTFSYTLPPLTAAHIVLEAEVKAPAITVAPASANAAAGAKVVLSVVADGTGPLSYQWRKGGVPVEGATASSLAFPVIATGDAGSYTVMVSNAAGEIESSPAIVAVSAGPWIAPTRAIINLSTRGLVGSGDQVMIVGFYVGGSGAKRLLLRAVGPTLAQAPYNVSGTLADPRITLTTPLGAVLASNDNWSDTDDLAALSSAITSTGAFPLPADSRDSALLIDLPAGGYTMIVRGAADTTGVAIAEIYDADPDSAAYLLNISTRGLVGTGDAVMIPGFVVHGSTPARLLVRAIGPTLALAPYNLTGVLADPRMEIVPNGGSPLASNDNWGNDPEIAAAFAQTSAFALPPQSLDAAIVTDFTAGNYTVLSSGANNGTGVMLAEVFLVP